MTFGDVVRGPVLVAAGGASLLATELFDLRSGFCFPLWLPAFALIVAGVRDALLEPFGFLVVFLRTFVSGE